MSDFDDLSIEQLRSRRRVLKRQANAATLSGRHGWGDHHRSQHIKEIDKEIRKRQSRKVE